MFGKVIYFDEATINDYKALITGKPGLKIEEYSVSNDKGLSADFKVLGADVKSAKSYTAKIQESNLYDCAEFEKLLSGRDDFYDITANPDYDISTIPNKCIIKVEGFIEIPEEFDMVKLIDAFKPMLLNANQFGGLEKDKREALEVIFANAQATKIPIQLDSDSALLCGKLLQQNLQIDYEELSDFDDEVTVLARVITPVLDKTKAYYDPLKDFMKLNRMMRKAINKSGNQFTPLFADTNYRTIEILAVYR